MTFQTVPVQNGHAAAGDILHDKDGRKVKVLESSSYAIKVEYPGGMRSVFTRSMARKHFTK
jgi:hypothetical protein